MRGFVAEERAAGRLHAQADVASSHSPAFSRRLGAHGRIGIARLRKYDGQEKSVLDRYVVAEELLAAGDHAARSGLARIAAETRTGSG